MTTADGPADGAHVLEFLDAYLDGELATTERTAVDRHLAACRTCRGELTALSTLDAALSDQLAGYRGDPDAIAAGVLARLETPRPRHRLRRRLELTLAAAAGVLLALALTLPFGPRAPETPRAATLRVAFTVALAPLQAVEGKTPRDLIQDGVITVPARVTTGPGGAAELEASGGSRLRLDGSTTIAVAADAWTLERGRLWLELTAPARFTIAGTELRLDRGAFLLETADGAAGVAPTTEIVCLRGSADFGGVAVGAGDGLRVAAGKDRTIDGPAPEFFVERRLLWMAPLLERPETAGERRALLRALAGYLGDTKAGALARDFLRELGGSAAEALVDQLVENRLAASSANRVATAALIADGLGPTSARPQVARLFSLLTDGDRRVRGHVFDALARSTGVEPPLARAAWLGKIAPEELREAAAEWHKLWRAIH